MNATPVNRITEYNLEPGVYRHYKGGLYVVTEVITHMEGPDNAMQPLPVPLVCYRDLTPIYKHVNGHPILAHQVYARPLNEFNGMAEKEGQQIKRFTHE